jgi:phospholipid/cholesterol/gamma-HCH transport system substrate-binding protein
MKRHYAIEILVGVFLVIAFVALMVLAFRISGLSVIGSSKSYKIYADFDNVGGLKVRAPVSIGGVRIGQVEKIILDPQTFRAHVTLQIEKRMNTIPEDSSASILTQGLLGANYINISPGFEEAALKPGAAIASTHSALILENILGQLIYKVTGDKKPDAKEKAQAL